MFIALINLIAWLAIAGVLWWAGNAILAKLGPWIAEPFASIIQIVLIVILALIIISVILQLIGAGAHMGINLPMYGGR